MDINITKEALSVNRVICEKKEMINIQGDMIVPDSKPDILNTVNTSGNVCIYKKEIMEGKIRIDGNILTYIMYLADGENDNIRGLNTGIDFSETINVPEITASMSADINTTIKSIECKVLNGRKISIKVALEVNIKVHSKEDIDIITKMNDENIQVLNKSMTINSLVGSGTTKAFVKENIAMPNTDNLAEILKAQICLVDKDIKISYNKILAKSDIEVKIIYLTEEGKICTTQTRIPLVGFIEMPNIKEENICETTYMIKNIIIKPNSVEEHSIYIEIEVEISCLTYEERELRIIDDMYCPGEKIEFDRTSLNTIANKQCKKDKCNIREKINVPELSDGNIIDVEINPIINKENRLNGKLMYEGELELNFIFTDRSALGISTKKISLPFEHTVEEAGNMENSKIDTVLEVSSQEFVNQTGGVVDANIDLNMEVDTYKNSVIPVINNISAEEEDNQEDYSVIIYVVKSGDTLWKIAKRFGSTVDDIARVNGMERPDKLNVGEKIYIPRYVLKRAKEPILISQNV